MGSKTYNELAEGHGSESLTSDALVREIEQSFEVGTIALAIFTDRVEFIDARDLNAHGLQRALELRVFTEDSELHAVRGDLGRGFQCRLINDADMSGNSYLDEKQYLDIAENDSGVCTTVGGGTFQLPAGHEDATFIKIRNYLDFDDDGLAQVVDFRIVGLE